MTTKLLILAFILCAHSHLIHGQLPESVEGSFALAKEQNKNVLLAFTGSDWCATCIRFDKRVWNDPSFIHFADSTLILVSVDFPQVKKLPERTMKENESLAEQYNPSGEFPFFIVMKPDRQLVAKLNYHNENAKEFIAMIGHYLH